ncbi:MAG TPA: hypothetical protein VK638_00595 [Edaphobacter sp.]|nr:hypothetical protein [Edaphobacter sp.]
MNAQDAANNILVDLDAESQRDLLSNAGQPQRGLRRFIATTASMRSFFAPFGPGRCLRSGENNQRYFRFLSTLWRWSRVEGFRTMAERRTRAGRMKRVHKPTMIRGTQVGRTLSTTIEDQQLMPEQCGFGDDGTESARPCQSGQGDDHQ